MFMTLWAYAPLRMQANSGNNPVGDLVKIAQWEQFETERIAATVAGGNRGHRQQKGSAALVVKDDTQLEQCEIEAHCLPRVATTIRICRFDADEGHRCRETKQADTGITNDLPTLTLHHVMKRRMPPVFPQILSQELHRFMEFAMHDIRGHPCRPCRSQTIDPNPLP